MDFETALKDFEKSLGNLKRTYAEKYNKDSCYLQIVITDDDYMTITSTDDTGYPLDCYREWLDTK